jgi:group I intron endonuclease
MGFIYKITNTITNKCYIGETIKPNPEDRWKNHISAIKNNRGCPALQDAVKKYGIDKFTFKVLIICFDEDRFVYEREYIKKYNSVAPNGYNILEGGEGGGFKGCKHTEETKEKLRATSKKWHSDPVNIQISKENTLKQMKIVKDSGIDWGKKVKDSELFSKAVKEGRVGGGAHKNGHLDIKTKEKISESLKQYYTHNSGHKHDIITHRTAMAKAVGTCVEQYTIEGALVKTYPSIAEAAREINVRKSAIQAALDKSHRTSKGFVWKSKKD